VVKRLCIVLISPHLYGLAQAHALSESRTVSDQVRLWATIGKAALDNPDLPIHFVQDLLLARKEGKAFAKPFVS
jgi:hypothetical protein